MEYKPAGKFSEAVFCIKYKPGDVTLVKCVYYGSRLRFTTFPCYAGNYIDNLERLCMFVDIDFVKL
jgi:hypothetical protein